MIINCIIICFAETRDRRAQLQEAGRVCPGRPDQEGDQMCLHDRQRSGLQP